MTGTALGAALALPVTRIAGAGRVDTAVAASRHAFPDGAPAAVVAAAGSFADALAAAPLAARLGGPLLLTGPRLPAAVRDELTRLGATEVVVVGGFGAVPVVVQAELRRAVASVRRIAGEHRVDTAGQIAREVGLPDGGEVVVASSATFADALSVAPLAAAHGLPVVLTRAGALEDDAAAAVTALGATRSLVVGGQAALSDAVAAALPAPTRVAGRERYETSVAVADLARERGATLSTVHVATGRDFPDALAAGPVAAAAGSVVLLVDGLNAAGGAAALAWLERHRAEVEHLVVFGGPGAVTGAVVGQLARAAA